jgi:hypothetical protein
MAVMSVIIAVMGSLLILFVPKLFCIFKQKKQSVHVQHLHAQSLHGTIATMRSAKHHTTYIQKEGEKQKHTYK